MTDNIYNNEAIAELDALLVDSQESGFLHSEVRVPLEDDNGRVLELRMALTDVDKREERKVNDSLISQANTELKELLGDVAYYRAMSTRRLEADGQTIMLHIDIQKADQYGQLQEVDFVHDLRALINKYNKEGESNTPDHVLSNYMLACLDAGNDLIASRDTWYGVHLEPGNSHFIPAKETEKV